MKNNKDVMNTEEVHKYGIDLMASYLNKEDYTILETNYELDTSPQIIAQKGTDMIFVLVSTFVYPKKNVKIDKSHIDVLKSSGQTYGAKCYVARVGLAYADGKNAKELGTPYKNADFLVKFKGLEEV